VDFKTRYVRTPRYIAERKARKALFGVYRNRSTNDPSVSDVSLNTANTTPMLHAGKLFSMKEDSPPTRLDPYSLKTYGEYDFDGKMTALTFTAHPKIDPVSGEMIAFAYEAKGDLSDDLAVYTMNNQGQIIKELWLKAPVVSMMHDFAITQKHIILPTTGMVTSKERLEQGLVHWAYDKTVPTYVGILPRDGTAKDVRWFKGPPDRTMLVHTTNARTEGNKVILEAPIQPGNFNPQFTSVDGAPYDPEDRKSTMQRWTFDLDSTEDTWQTEILFNGVTTSNLVRIDDRYLSLPNRYSYVAAADAEFPFDEQRGGNLTGNVYNTWYRLDHNTGKIDKYFAGPVHGIFEPQFVPRHADAAEGDGFLIGACNNYAEMKSELVIVDAQQLKAGELARVKLPFRLHMQVHGWWAPSSVLPFNFEEDNFA
jgi:carotenoid cleavage dioxygenase